MKYFLAAVAGLVLAACTSGTPGPSRTGAGAVSAGPATPSGSTTRDSAASSPSGSQATDARTCTNDAIGFTVDYPADWWANETVEPTFEGGTPIPACTYFAPEEVELQPNAGLPEGIAVWFDVETEFQITGEQLSSVEADVDGRPSLVIETEATGSGGFEPAGTRSYRYIIPMEGNQLLVSTSTLYIDDAAYEETKDILDTMMETLDFSD